jgi:S1-C subfamily serine protease
LALVDWNPSQPVEIHYVRGGSEGLASVNLRAINRNVSLVSSKSNAADHRQLDERVWRQLGLRLADADPKKVRQADAHYKGGLRIWDVRDQSPAHAAQIRDGDILVGLIDWQTPNWEDLAWVMDSTELKSSNKHKFYIIRGQTVFTGVMEAPRKVTR